MDIAPFNENWLCLLNEVPGLAVHAGHGMADLPNLGVASSL
jgi:hypothetical protein